MNWQATLYGQKFATLLANDPLDTADSYPHRHCRTQQMLRAISYFFFNLDINHATRYQVYKDIWKDSRGDFENLSAYLYAGKRLNWLNSILSLQLLYTVKKIVLNLTEFLCYNLTRKLCEVTHVTLILLYS